MRAWSAATSPDSTLMATLRPSFEPGGSGIAQVSGIIWSACPCRVGAKCSAELNGASSVTERGTRPQAPAPGTQHQAPGTVRQPGQTTCNISRDGLEAS